MVLNLARRFAVLLAFFLAVAYGAAQTTTSGPISSQQINYDFFVGGPLPSNLIHVGGTDYTSGLATACAANGGFGRVIIPQGSNPSDAPTIGGQPTYTITGGCTNVTIRDMRGLVGDVCYSYTNSTTYTSYTCTVGGSLTGAVLLAPSGNQTVTQPSATNFNVVTSGGGKVEYNGSEICSTGNGLCPDIPYGSFLANIPTANCVGGYLLSGLSGSSATDWCGGGNAATVVGSPSANYLGVALNVSTTGQYISAPTAVNTTRTFFVAGFFPTFGNSYGYSWGDATNFAFNETLICGTNSNLFCIINTNPHALTSKLGTDSGVFYPVGTTYAPEYMTSGRHVFAFVCGNGSGDKIYYDGRPVTLGATGNNCPTTTGSGNNQLGGSSLLTGTYGNFIATAWFNYTTQMTSAQVGDISTALDNYLDALGAVQSSTRPLAASSTGAPILNACCDSRTEGNPSTSWVTALSLNDATTVVNNEGQSGSGSYDWCNGPYMLNQASPKSGNEVADIIWVDINDIDFAVWSTNTGNIILGNNACAVKNFSAAGAAVFMTTEISGGGNTFDVGKNYLDPYIRLNAVSSWGAASVVDLADVPVLGADGASTNTTYFVSGSNIHPTNLSQTTIIAPIMSNAINEFYGSSPSAFNSTSATSYQELAADGYLELTGGSAQTITLADCQGYTRRRTIWNTGANAATVVPGTTGFGSSFTQTIDTQSSVTVPAYSTWVGQPVPGPMATGGCSWRTVSIKGTGGGSGTVTTFSAGTLSPLFTTSVATATTTPALTFALTNAAQNSIFAGPPTGGAGAPSYQTAPTFSAANLTSIPPCTTCMTGTTPTNHGVLLGAGTQAVGVTAAGTASTVLIGQSGADPIFSNNPTLSGLSLTATSSASVLSIINSTAATNVANQGSALAVWDSNYWTGSASAVDGWTLGTVLGSGTNPTTTLTFTHSTGSSGAASVAVPAFALNGSQVMTGIQGSTGVKFAAATGAFTNGNCRQTDANGNEADSGAACGAGGTPAYPQTVTGCVSGGILYGSLTTQVTCSPAGTAGQVVLWGGAGTAPGSQTIGTSGSVLCLVSATCSFSATVNFTTLRSMTITDGSNAASLPMTTLSTFTANGAVFAYSGTISPTSLSSTQAGMISSAASIGAASTTYTGMLTGTALRDSLGAATSTVYNGSQPLSELYLAPTINVATTSTAGYAVLNINPTETSISTAPNYLIWAGAGGTQKFTLSNGGTGLFAGTVTSALGNAAITSATGGTGVTSVTCATAPCNVSRGSYTIVGGTATTGTIATLVWPTTTTAWVCSVDMNGGTGFLGIGHGVATATGMTITAGITVIGITFTVDYNCVP